jgi:hypothetical protein
MEIGGPSKNGAVRPALLAIADNRDMAYSRLRKSVFTRRVGLTAALFASSALLVATWGVPAQADGGGGGAFKIVGASYAQELEFAGCMREHGEPDFPDPSTNGVFSLNGIDSNSPQYTAAQRACQSLLPKPKPVSPAEQARLLQKALAFATCMRSHGEPGYPDPSSQGGGISFSLRGLDPNSPQFHRAQQACRNLSPFPGGGPGAP